MDLVFEVLVFSEQPTWEVFTLYFSSSGEGYHDVQLVKCWPGVHKSLGSVLSTTYMGHGGICW